jgi:CHAT domain-containing protein
LPCAAAEVAAIAAQFDAKALVGENCTPAAILDRLERAEHLVLHLAVHGRGDSRRGQRASVLLCKDGGGTEWVDLKHLLAGKIRLVVLSGCSTGVTGPLHGHELVSVARAAAEAGASAVIACLWPVADSVAEKFMIEFYKDFAAQKVSGSIDLVASFDRARASLREWLKTAPVRLSSRVRDARDLILGETDNVEGLSLDSDSAETIAWAPFVLLGHPILGHKLA